MRNTPNQKTVRIDGIGDVFLRKHHNSKHIRIKVIAFEGVRVTLPRSISFKQAINFVKSRADWVREAQKRMKEIEHKEQSNMPDMYSWEAIEILRKRLNELSTQFDLPYNRVSFRRQKTRWGSCSHRNDISLNISIAALEEDLIDYVLLHELIHTKVKNHSPQFWNELEKVCPQAKEKRKRLRQFTPYHSE
jgi:predicted metal-dependent hydrolase